MNIERQIEFDKVKDALEGDDTDEIKKASEELSNAVMELSSRVYQEQAAESQANAENGNAHIIADLSSKDYTVECYIKCNLEKRWISTVIANIFSSIGRTNYLRISVICACIYKQATK